MTTKRPGVGQKVYDKKVQTFLMTVAIRTFAQKDSSLQRDGPNTANIGSGGSR
jgi:hypothetical protein